MSSRFRRGDKVIVTSGGCTRSKLAAKAGHMVVASGESTTVLSCGRSVPTWKLIPATSANACCMICGEAEERRVAKNG